MIAKQGVLKMAIETLKSCYNCITNPRTPEQIRVQKLVLKIAFATGLVFASAIAISAIFAATINPASLLALISAYFLFEGSMVANNYSNRITVRAGSITLLNYQNDLFKYAPVIKWFYDRANDAHEILD